MKIIHSPYYSHAKAWLINTENEDPYTIIRTFDNSPLKDLLRVRPVSKHKVFRTLRENLPITDEGSPYDIVLPGEPLQESLRIWRREKVSNIRPMISTKVHGRVVRYFSGQDIRLDRQISLIKVCAFIAKCVNYRHWCAFYSSKEIAIFTGISTPNVSRCIDELESMGLLSIVVCRSKYKRKVVGSYVKITKAFKDTFLNDIEWPDSEPLYPYTENDYLKHLHENERVGRELQSLIQRQNYPECVINHAYFLLTC